eukprot:2097190-Prymnesium_polylepis.1
MLPYVLYLPPLTTLDAIVTLLTLPTLPTLLALLALLALHFETLYILATWKELAAERRASQ